MENKYILKNNKILNFNSDKIIAQFDKNKNTLKINHNYSKK